MHHMKHYAEEIGILVNVFAAQIAFQAYIRASQPVLHQG